MVGSRFSLEFGLQPGVAFISESGIKDGLKPELQPRNIAL